ncbi:MAG TPA: ABC transporter substrate-binding protein [Stellaceae bacterium]|nr:ABC transporter substrate-binding protein [Stellaceae bacterium]
MGVKRSVPAIPLLALAMAALLASPTAAQKKYAPGVSDSEIKIGQTMPYSGAASAYSAIGKAELGYIAMINEHGGINGRKINLISLDDGYSPPKTFEQTRRLVEQEQVAFIFSSLGTPTGIVVHKYLNEHKVPQIFQASGATFWGDPQHFPWSIGWQPNYQTEGAIYGRYLLQHKPDAKIAVLYQNDDAGRDYFAGFKAGLGADAAKKMIVAVSTYEVTDPTLDSQIVTLQSSGADVLFDNATPKFAAQAIRKVYDVGWKPTHFLMSVATSVSAVMEPAGLEKSQGIITAQYLKDPNDQQWKDDPAFVEWRAFMQKYYPDGNLGDSFNVYGYTLAQTLVQVVKQCGDDLSRENVMKQVAHLDLNLPLLLPGIKIHTTPSDFYPIQRMRLARFEGKQWVGFGDVIGE